MGICTKDAMGTCMKNTCHEDMHEGHMPWGYTHAYPMHIPAMRAQNLWCWHRGGQGLRMHEPWGRARFSSSSRDILLMSSPLGMAWGAPMAQAQQADHAGPGHPLGVEQGQGPSRAEWGTRMARMKYQKVVLELFLIAAKENLQYLTEAGGGIDDVRLLEIGSGSCLGVRLGSCLGAGRGVGRGVGLGSEVHGCICFWES